MKLWEWVLNEDRSLDLTDPAVAVEWFVAHRMEHVPFALKWDDRRPPWPNDVLARWQANVRALRSLAVRLHKRRTRETDIDPIEADQLFTWHLSGLRLMLSATDEVVAHLAPLKASTFYGVGLSWGKVSVDDYPELDRVFGMLAGIQDAMWRMIFGSLATDELPPVCSAPGCGKPLAPTPGGRTPRVSKCKTCRYAEWYAKQPKTKLRARWARNKRNERNANKGSEL